MILAVLEIFRQHESQQLLSSGINSFTNNASEKNLRLIRQENLNRIILAHLNINSIRNKFDLLANQTTGNVDVLAISETKFDASFPIDQFEIPGFPTLFRRDRDQYGGGLLVFVREDTPAKHLSSESTPIEGINVELNFCKKNWLLCCTYNPNRNIIKNHLDALKRSLDPYSTKYNNLVVIGDLNAEINLECMKLFL